MDTLREKVTSCGAGQFLVGPRGARRGQPRLLFPVSCRLPIDRARDQMTGAARLMVLSLRINPGVDVDHVCARGDPLPMPLRVIRCFGGSVRTTHDSFP